MITWAGDALIGFDLLCMPSQKKLLNIQADCSL